MFSNFRSYQLAVQLYKDCKSVQLPGYLKDQLLRAASSVVLNLAEGSGRSTRKDRVRFYSIAFGSLRETQSIIDMEEGLRHLNQPADTLAAHIYKLVRQ